MPILPGTNIQPWTHKLAFFKASVLSFRDTFYVSYIIFYQLYSINNHNDNLKKNFSRVL